MPFALRHCHHHCVPAGHLRQLACGTDFGFQRKQTILHERDCQRIRGQPHWTAAESAYYVGSSGLILLQRNDFQSGSHSHRIRLQLLDSKTGHLQKITQ